MEVKPGMITKLYVHTHIYYYSYYYYYYLLLLLLLLCNPSRQHSEVLYRWGIRRRGKIGKHGKVEVKKKWWAPAQPPYSSQGNGGSHQSGNHRDRPADAENNPGSRYRQRMGDKRGRGRIPDTFT